MDAANDYTRVHHLIDTIAMRAVVHLDDLTLGQHPDATAREDGKLALLDWSRTGGPIVSDGARRAPIRSALSPRPACRTAYP